MRNALKPKKDVHGSIMLLALFFMVVLFFLATAFFRLLPTELHSAARSSRDMKGHYAADAGVKNAAAWLELQLGTMDQSYLDSNYNSTYDVSTPVAIAPDWGWTARIEVNPTGNGLYDIVSKAYFRDNPIREVRATVKQDTFAKYALFIDRWPSGNANPTQDLIFTMGSGSIQGPFHTNDFFNLKAPDGNYWTTTGDPWIAGAKAKLTYTRSMPEAESTLGPGIGDGNRYYGGNYMGSDSGFAPFNTTDGSPISARYARMVDGGREKINKVSHINLPDKLANVQALSWDRDEDQTGQNLASLGININTDAGPNTTGGNVKGGIYIDGDADKLHLELDQGNQSIRVRAKENYWRIWNPTKFYDDDWDCVPNGTYSQGPELFNYVPCDEWGIIDYILPNGSNGLTAPEPVYGWIPNGTTCPEPFNPRQFGPDVENCTNTLICEDCIPRGGWDEVPAGTPGAQERTRSQSHDSFAIEVSEDSGYSIPANEWVDGELKTTGFHVPKDSTIVKLYNEDEGRYEWTTMSGSTNGVVFVDGHINSLKGINKGSKYTDAKGIDDYHGRLIATNIENGKDITITDDILQYYDGADPNKIDSENPNALKRGELSPTDQHILGIIGEDVTINTPNRPGTHFAGNDALVAYAVIMAGRTETNSDGTPRLDGNGRPRVRGGFGVHSGDMENGDGLGLFRLFGGLIGANGKKTYNNAGGGQHGYGLELNYDTIAAENLENFPTYNNYSLVRYVERFIDS